MRDSDLDGDGKFQNYRNSGNQRVRVLRPGRNAERVMKNLKRFLFGAFSSLLLTAGFVRAADRLDPMSRTLTSVDTGIAQLGAPDSSMECDVLDRSL